MVPHQDNGVPEIGGRIGRVKVAKQVVANLPAVDVVGADAVRVAGAAAMIDRARAVGVLDQAILDGAIVGASAVPEITFDDLFAGIEESIVIEMDPCGSGIRFEIDGVVVDGPDLEISHRDVLSVEKAEAVSHGIIVHAGAADDDVVEVVGRAADGDVGHLMGKADVERGGDLIRARLHDDGLIRYEVLNCILKLGDRVHPDDIARGRRRRPEARSRGRSCRRHARLETLEP